MAGARRHRQALTVAVLLVVVAAVDLTAVLLWQPTSRSVPHDVLVVLWPLPALAGVPARRLRALPAQPAGDRDGPHLRTRHRRAPAARARCCARSCRPIYGPNAANDDVVAGVLGGNGMRPHGDDLTISTGTTVKLELQGIDTKTYHLMTTQTIPVPATASPSTASSSSPPRTPCCATRSAPHAATRCSSSTSSRTRRCSSTRSTTCATPPRSPSTTSTTTASGAPPNPARSRRSR